MSRKLIFALCLCLPAAGQAQQDSARAVVPPIVKVGTGVTGAAAAGAAVGGVVWNREADRRYEDLEMTCSNTPARCSRLTPGGAFNDAELESEYQDILKLDDRAQLALIASEVAIAASVVLFILDLPRDNATADKPYTPPKLQVRPRRSGFELSYRIR